MRRLGSLLIALALWATPAWAVVTQKVAVNATTWTDLGAGPLLIAPYGRVVYAISDTTPAIPAREGFPLVDNVSVTVNTASHIYAMAQDSASAAVYVYVAPVTAGGSSAGTTGPVNGIANSFVDGWSQTHGSTTDTAWGGSGAGSLVAIEKKISAQMAGAIPAQAADGVVIGAAQPVASTLGGATPYNLIAASGTNSTLVSAGVHTVYGVQLANIGTAPAYLKLYDKATAPTCGTDIPKAVFVIPAAATAALGGGSNVAAPVGKAFALGLGFCVVLGIDNTPATGVAASNVVINIDYK